VRDDGKARFRQLVGWIDSDSSWASNARRTTFTHHAKAKANPNWNNRLLSWTGI